MSYVYILELCNNKYYIGKLYEIHNLDIILNNSFEWFLYNNIKQIIGIDTYSYDVNEDIYVFKFMSLYGINNVRGGSFNQMNLTFDNTYDLFINIKLEYNKCYLCGKKNHNGDKCKLRYKYDYELLVILITSNIVCYICNNKGHYKEECKFTQLITDFDIISV